MSAEAAWCRAPIVGEVREHRQGSGEYADPGREPVAPPPSRIQQAVVGFSTVERLQGDNCPTAQRSNQREGVGQLPVALQIAYAPG
jgi:hypothetical protein